MTSHLDDTDDENCDDPIKLFPNGFDSSIVFGSQPEITGKILKPASNKSLFLEGQVEIHSESNSECTISPIFVKLVDCVKFPWYFGKYTAPILQKTDPNPFETENEFIDVEECDSNSSDCFIVEDLHPETTGLWDPKEIPKRFKIVKQLEKASSQRKLSQFDLKRNIGLVGMKICQKKSVTIKQGACIGKTASQVIAKSDNEEMRSHCKLDNNKKPSNSLVLPLHSNFKLPKNITNNINPKQNCDQKNRDLDKRLTIVPVHKLSKKAPSSIVLKKSLNKSTSHVKDIQKCNKFKNDQIKKNKTNNSTVIEMFEPNKTIPKTSQVPEIRQNCAENSENKIDSQSDNKEELKSPILTCTSLKKPKSDIASAVIGNNPKNKLDKIVNKLKILSKIPLNVSSTISTPCDIPTKTTLTNEIQEKAGPPIGVISKTLLHKLDKSIKHYNNHNKNRSKPGKFDKPHSAQSNSNDIKVSITSNVVLNANPISLANIVTPLCPKTNSHVKCFDSSQSHSNQSKDDLTTSHVVLNTSFSLEAPKQVSNTVGNPNVTSKTVVKPSNATSSFVTANHDLSTNDCLKPQFIVHSLPKKLFHRNNSSSYTATNVLKNKCDLLAGSKPEHLIQSTDPQMPKLFHNSQVQCQDHRGPNLNSATNMGNQLNNIPNVVNQSQPTSTNQDCLPNNNIYQQANPVPNFYANRVLLPLPPPPPPMYVPPPFIYQTKQTSSNANCSTSMVLTNQLPTTTSQDHMRSLQIGNQHNSSIIGVNYDGLVKKINIGGTPKSSNDTQECTINKNVVSKISSTVQREIDATKLQKLNKPSLPAEGISSKISDRAINGTNIEKSLEVAIMTKNRGAFETLKLSVDNINTYMQKKQSKGYSPPILPIPTYNKVLNQVSAKVSTDLAAKTNYIPKIPMKKTDCGKSNKRKGGALNIADNRRKIGAKKISLEEYNKRAFKDNKSVPSKRTVSDDQNKHGRKRQNINKKNNNNRDHTTETDLGYDSDSTVVL
ncbi:hypothetical protein HF086_009266 [Spodoptera exigua]|uniref:Uncharacterized protein n=1 Tax=Spodoptera exigua TaxID=7107 RepID=A0A922MDT8_SPOEX|nr:hypothetical protein HF086_009266 [Spodoptera exigua]